MRRAPAYRLLLLGGLLLSSPALAFYGTESEEGERSLEMTGAMRLTGAWLHLPEVSNLPAGSSSPGDDGLAAMVARLLLGGDLHQKVGYEVNLFLDLTRAPTGGGGGALATVGAASTPYRYRHLGKEFWEDGAMAGSLGLDRLAITARLDPVVISAGRFPVNFSVTSLFAPNDLFAPFSATAINKIYKPGVDALRVNWAPTGLTQISLVGVLGAGVSGPPGWSESALLARASTVLWNFDLAVLGGKVAGRWLAGWSFQGEAGSFGVRGEGHVAFPDANGDGTLDQDAGLAGARGIHVKAALGVDRRFTWQNASIAFEALYQSDAPSRPSGYLEQVDRLLPDELPYLGRLHLGLSGGLELLPILTANAMVLLNAQDFSGLAALMLLYNLADEADALFGVLIPWGDGPALNLGRLALESEYGAAPLTVFLETRFYF